MAKSTPWGPSQHEEAVAPGIVFYSTAGHGGYHLDRDRMAAFHRLFPTFITFAGGPWFEEDCDAAAVVIAFPEHFSEDSLRCAIESAEWSMNRPAASNDDWTAVVARGRQLMHAEDCMCMGCALSPRKAVLS